MSRFEETYWTMTEEDVAAYVLERTNLFEKNATLSVKEIGDGNLNYVFLILDKAKQKSFILKQAGPVARISEEFRVSPDRNRIEYELLYLQNQLNPTLVPKVYQYDAVMNCLLMEDLSEYTILRTALMCGDVTVGWQKKIADFIARTIVLTSDYVLHPKEKKAMQKQFINPELCDITEALVFSEPFWNCPRNDVSKLVRAYCERNLWHDVVLKQSVAKLKFGFMTKAQSLIHGDLHTGSIFVRGNDVKVIDHEFGFYGPSGFDLGTLTANIIFAYLHQEALQLGSFHLENSHTLFKIQQIENTLVSFIDEFVQVFVTLWQQAVLDDGASGASFLEDYLNEILSDAAGAAGCELIRRIVGIAHVSDMTSIESESLRDWAACRGIMLGKLLILNRHQYRTGKDYRRLLAVRGN